MKRLWIALLVLIGLGGWIYFVELEGKEKKLEAEDNLNRLVPFPVFQSEKIEVKARDGATMVLAKGTGEDGWRMMVPVSDAVDSQRLDDLLMALELARVSGSLSDIDDLASYGLANPAVSLQIQGPREKVSLTLGGSAPISGLNYLQRNDDGTVLLVSEPLRSNLLVEVDELRDRRVFRFAPEQVTGMTIIDGSSRLRLERKSGHWKVLEPVELPGDSVLIEGVLGNLAELQVESFLPIDDSEKFEAGRGSLRIAFDFEDHSSTEIEFGANIGQDRPAWVPGRPQPILVADFILQQVRKPPFEFRDRRLFPVNPQEIKRVVLFRKGEKTVEIERAGKAWRAVGGETPLSLETESINRFLVQLADWRVQEWKQIHAAALANFQLDPAIHALEAYNEDGRRLASIALGQDADEWTLWVRAGEQNIVGRASRDFMDRHWNATFGDIAVKSDPK